MDPSVELFKDARDKTVVGRPAARGGRFAATGERPAAVEGLLPLDAYAARSAAASHRIPQLSSARDRRGLVLAAAALSALLLAVAVITLLAGDRRQPFRAPLQVAAMEPQPSVEAPVAALDDALAAHASAVQAATSAHATQLRRERRRAERARRQARPRVAAPPAETPAATPVATAAPTVTAPRSAPVSSKQPAATRQKQQATAKTPDEPGRTAPETFTRP